MPLAACTPDAAHFAAPRCHNCGAGLDAAYCGQCGQKRAHRFGLRAVGGEAWQNYRLFEMDNVRAAWHLLRAPGTVAREFVLGARTRHVHPLKLLAVAIGALLLVLNQVAYLDSRFSNVNQAMETIKAYANWSFSLGIVAIVGSSWLVLRRGQPFNFTEHLVLGVYAHFLVISASVISLLPTLVWRAPSWLAAHKAAAGLYMPMVEAALVGLAFGQFFALRGAGGRLRLFVAIALFAALKWALIRLYATVLAKLWFAGWL